MSTALTTVPALRVHEGAAFANSRDVADYFGKEHGPRVMKDIRRLVRDLKEAGQNCLLWFRPSTYKVERSGRGAVTYPAFDMTKDGFALLVMGFTGKPALAFKVAYIEAFNAMQARLEANARVAMLKDVQRALPAPTRVHSMEFMGQPIRALLTGKDVEIVIADVARLAYPRVRETGSCMEYVQQIPASETLPLPASFTDALRPLTLPLRTASWPIRGHSAPHHIH